MLRQQFDQVEGEIIAAARGGEGLFEQAANNLRQLVTVRPVGAKAEGENAAAVVARAQARLQEGDLAAAVQEVEQLSGEAAQAAQPWLDQARARLAAEEAVSALQARTAELLTSAR